MRHHSFPRCEVCGERHVDGDLAECANALLEQRDEARSELVAVAVALRAYPDSDLVSLAETTAAACREYTDQSDAIAILRGELDEARSHAHELANAYQRGDDDVSVYVVTDSLAYRVDPVCSVCRRRHPSDGRHPCE